MNVLANHRAMAIALKADRSPSETDFRDDVGNIHLDRLLDNQRVGVEHLLVVALCFIILVVDGYDLFVTAQLLPAIAHDFKTTSAALTKSFAAQTVGQALGALALSPFADRFGRKPTLLICLLLFGLTTLCSAVCSNVLLFSGIRFVSGVFGGAVLPITVSLAADLSPLKGRSSVIGIVYAGLTVGQLGAAGFMAWLLRPYGWHAAFWIGGVTPLLLMLFVASLLPESPRYLARRNPNDVRIRPALRRLGIRLFTPVLSFVTAIPERQHQVPVAELFMDGRARLTILLWIPSLLSLSASTLIGLAATFFHEFASVPLASFAAALSLLIVGGIIAMFITGAVMDRVGEYRVIVMSALAGGLVVCTLAFVPFGTSLFRALVFFCGFFMAATQQGLNIVAPTLYPASVRSSAVGAKVAVSRLASAAAPLLGGVVLARHSGLSAAMLVTAAPLFLICLFTPWLAASAKRLSG